MVLILKLVKSLTIKAARAKHTSIQFIPLRDSGTGTYKCGWCETVVRGRRSTARTVVTFDNVGDVPGVPEGINTDGKDGLYVSLFVLD